MSVIIVKFELKRLLLLKYRNYKLIINNKS